jgi:type I restriction-modification system DNA methylase subunit
MMNQELAYTEIQKLITSFKNMPAAQRKGLNEMQTRLGYILPMFKALGWDTSNINEVSPEEKVSRGWVDFSFRVGNVPRFFLETKRANEDLNDPRWVQQAIDYAWTKSVTWALLSDFEGLRVFNAEWKESDPFRAQFFEFGIDDYLKDFERLWWLSKQETISRRLDIEAEKVGRKIKRLPVSQNLFDDLKRWRENLFKNYKAFNLGYSAAQIDESVLRLLNRLIFIRTAEDREVEENRLQSLVRVLKDKKQIQTLDREITSLFRELDGIYNSELFARHFSEELQIPPTELEEIISGLYDKNYTRYNFNALEADVLGTAYEQYLGHIVAEGETETHVEEKRTKRKSQGIYYTPAFVTKYVVQQTVGKYLDENGYSPSKPPRVLDMACGSGSFLIEAFDVVDNYVAKQRGQAQKGEVDFYDRARQLEVLQSCIFGVDKDKQAVEVARLNLLLRGLHSREKLPMLENIRHGNSLVSGTQEELEPFFGEEWKAKEPFNWEWEFKSVLQNGGFDLIIGNPPYVNVFNLPPADVDFYEKRYTTFKNKYDLYGFFMEKAVDLLKEGGLLGFITSRTWFSIDSFSRLREFLLNSGRIIQIAVTPSQTFANATVETAILLFQKDSDNNRRMNNVIDIVEYNEETEQFEKRQEISQRVFSEHPKQLINLEWSSSTNTVFERMKVDSIELSQIASFSLGIKTSDNDKFIFNRKQKEVDKPVLRGRDIYNYRIEPNGLWLRYIPDEIKKLHGARPRDPNSFFRQEKIVLREISKQEIIAAYDTESYLILDTANVIFTEKDNPYSLKYLLALLNSKLINWWYGSQFKGLHVKLNELAIIPVHKIDFENSKSKIVHDEIVKLVEKMLILQKERQAVRPEDNLDNARNLDRKIKEVDTEINEKIFKLYGLSDEEIKIVEGK